MPPPGHTWIIPVRFDDVSIPAWELSASRTLSDINYVNFFGEHKLTATAQLTQKLGELMGTSTPDPDQIQASIQGETPQDRAHSLSKLTKDMLPNPQRRIALDELVSAEVQTLLQAITDTDVNETYGQLQSRPERACFAAERAEHLAARAAAPFCATLQVAARFGQSDQLELWATGMKRLVHAANAEQARYEELDSLRHVPAVLAILTATLAATEKKAWGNLKVLMADQTVTIPYQHHYKDTPKSILDATDMYQTMESNLANLLRARSENKRFDEVIDGRQKYHTPQAIWFHDVLRPWFTESPPIDTEYDALFDQAVVIFGLLSTDEIITARTPEDKDRTYLKQTRWIDRAMRRGVANFHPNPIAAFNNELERQRADWSPLKAGLFGGSTQRAEAALEEYGEIFEVQR